MDPKEIFLRQFSACHNEDTWFVSLSSAIKGLSSEQASYKSNNSTNSILEIVNHLNFYNQLELNRFNGVPDCLSVSNNDSTFSNLHESNWNIILEQILNTMKEWKSIVENCDKEYLEKRSENLAYLTLHNAYHIGQIVHIRKNHGLWDKNKGVNYTF